MYQKVLSEFLQTLPSYLGGQCRCSRCASFDMSKMHNTGVNDHPETVITEIINNPLDLTSVHSGEQTEIPTNYNCDQVLRKVVISILLFWVLVAFIAGVYDPESRPILPPWAHHIKFMNFSLHACVASIFCRVVGIYPSPIFVYWNGMFFWCLSVKFLMRLIFLIWNRNFDSFQCKLCNNKVVKRPSSSGISIAKCARFHHLFAFRCAWRKMLKVGNMSLYVWKLNWRA